MIKLQSLKVAKFKQLDDVTIEFPTRGSVLIQGLNEAGKSTLFESVFFGLFGKALVTEEPNRLEDLINYQSPRALVRLAFSTDSAEFTVSRTLNRGKPNTAVLEVRYAGGKPETVTSLAAVNKRVVDELGLDGEALLNSCFVEQKKLEKLESMSAQQRRDTLLRLLNLDRLAALEAQYKPASSDDLQLQQLRDRLKLAQIQRDLPPARERLLEVEAQFRLLAAARLRNELAGIEQSLRAEEQQQAALKAEGAELAQVVAELEQLKAVRDLAHSAGTTLDAIQEDGAEIERLGRELAQLQAEAARLPELEADLNRLEALAQDLAELAQLEEAQAQRRRELAALAERGQRVEGMRAAVAERQEALRSAETQRAQAQNEVQQAEAAERQARAAELLRAWQQIREVARIAEEGERQLGQRREELLALERRVSAMAADRGVRRRTALGLALSAAVSLVLAVALAASGFMWAVAGAPLAAALAFTAWRCYGQVRTASVALRGAETAASQLRVEINRREGEQALARRTGQDHHRQAEIEAELAALGIDVRLPLPSHPERPGEAAASVAEARQALGVLEGRVHALERELAGLRSQLEAEGDPAALSGQLEAEIEREAQALAGRRGALPDGPETEAKARELAAAARASAQGARAAAAKAEALAGTLAERESRLAQREAELAETWAELERLRPGAPRTTDACREIWNTARQQLEALDEPALRRAVAQNGQAIAASQERVSADRRRTTEIEAALAQLDLGGADVPEVDPDQLDTIENQLRQEQRELFGAVATLEHGKASLEQQLGLQGVEVDFAEAEKELAGFQERLEIRKQAHRIVTLARRNIVGKVLPSTIRNMGLLLPLLTNDRYREVHIDPDTYKIKVWDETAHAMKAKDIFSGGTRDQFSLALRLAFALATLPEELGTAPGFIFLDEPLSSFDSVRTNALVNLLTRGPVAANFDQIFVISHSRAFDEELFDYHLLLDSGRIVESDLPTWLDGMSDQAPVFADGARLGAGMPEPEQVA